MKKKLSIVDQGHAAAEHDHHTHCSSEVQVNVVPPTSMPGAKFRGRAAIVTLGCAKNQVDSEVMLGVLRNHGFDIASSIDDADVAIVNTCGFLESAVKESVDAILNVAERKETGRLRKLIVAGCAVSRYGAELKKSLPEVDGFLSTDEILRVGAMATAALAILISFAYLEEDGLLLALGMAAAAISLAVTGVTVWGALHATGMIEDAL